jgi:hypothetical protein
VRRLGITAAVGRLRPHPSSASAEMGAIGSYLQAAKLMDVGVLALVGMRKDPFLLTGARSNG